MLRAGVAGVGRLGKEHARLLSSLSGVRLAGVHDIDTDRGDRVAESVGVPHHRELASLAGEADAVVVAVPTRDHHAVATAVLEAGCHALVEKPLATTLEEADDLIARAESLGLTLAVGHVERYNPAVRACRPYLHRPRFLESLRLAPFQPRGTDVTVILDLMIHDIDLILGLVDSPLESLHAVGTPVLTESVDIANARLVFADGSVAEITASRVSEERTRKLRLFQPTGYVRLDLARGEGEFLRRRVGMDPTAGAGEGEAPSLDDLVERVPLRGDDREPLRLELEAFRDAVLGEGDDIVSAREGREALDIAFRISQEVDRFAEAGVR